MATTVRQVEAVPATWPDPPAGLSADAAALDAGVIWSRLEGWIAHRWSPREVIWTVEGEGAWTCPLVPATVLSVEVWEASVWVVTVPLASPFGGYDFGDGPYRVTATVGGGVVPAAVLEAYRRLAEYSAGKPGVAGATSHKESLGPIETGFERNPAWAAKALPWSGAADLLRAYRRA